MMYKILIVDDEPDVRATLVPFLADEGHSVQAVASVAEALAIIVSEDFDFAFVDIRLHGDSPEDESGLGLAGTIRMLKPRTRVVLFTRYVLTKQIVRAIRYCGAVGFIEKGPNLGTEILKALAETRQSPFWQSSDETRLSLSLAENQPLRARARGRYVCSACVPTDLKLEAKSYVRKAGMAETDHKNFRFIIQDLGNDLWKTLLAPYEIHGAYLEARAISSILHLQVDTPRSLLQLPIEFMRSDVPEEYLVLLHPVSRFICGATPKRGVMSPTLLAYVDRLRVLIIASNTEPEIPGVDQEARELRDYLLHQKCINADVRLIPSEQATYERVQHELQLGNYDILHYAGHGAYEKDSPEESFLLFWNEENMQGGVRRMRCEELKLLLEQSSARLVYFSCCFGSASGEQGDLLDDDFLGLADCAVHAGIPGVIGFRWAVTDKGAQRLACAFYESLLDQGSPEVALWTARRKLAAWNRNDSTWLSPILIHQE